MGVRSAYLKQEIISDTISFPVTFHGECDYSLLPQIISKGCKSPSSCWDEAEDSAKYSSMSCDTENAYDNHEEKRRESINSTVLSFETPSSDSGFNEDFSMSFDEMEKQLSSLSSNSALFVKSKKKESIANLNTWNTYITSLETLRRKSVSLSICDTFDAVGIKDFENSFEALEKRVNSIDTKDGQMDSWDETLSSEESSMNDSFDENAEDIPSCINFQYPEKKRLKPSLEYYIAPIFPYCRKDHLNEEEKKTADAIRNVVARKYGPKMRKSMNNFNKSLCRMRDSSLAHRTNKLKDEEIYSWKNGETSNESRLSELLTMRSRAGSKLTNGMDKKTEQNNNDRITEEKSMKAVFQLSIDEGSDEINRIVEQQDTIISQANKALEICQAEEKSRKNMIHIEVQRIILKANVTKEIIKKYKTKYSYQDPEDKSGFIKISNLGIFLKKYNERKEIRSQYVCILHCGTTVYCSTPTYSKKQRKLELPESYVFEDLPSDFQIGCQIYVIQTNSCRKRSFYNLIKSCGLLLKSLFICSNSPSEMEETRIRGGFEKCGEFLITKSVSDPKDILLENRSQRNHITEKLEYDIESGVNLKYEMFGYLLIYRAEKQGGWIKQWCELDGAELKFLDNPGSEAEPEMTVDLSRSLLRRIPYADRTVCYRDKSLHLKFKPEFSSEGAEHRDVFLSCDDQEVLADWKIKMNIVLFNLQNWGCMKI